MLICVMSLYSYSLICRTRSVWCCNISEVSHQMHRCPLLSVQAAANTMQMGKLLSALVTPFFGGRWTLPLKETVKALRRGSISPMGAFEGISFETAHKGHIAFSLYIETAHICNCVLMHLSVFLFCVCMF